VHPTAIAVMEELGASMEQAASKGADAFRDEEFDAVVTVCDSAAQDCPTWPGARRLVHWSIEDPSFAWRDPARERQRFVETRDDLRERIRGLVAELFGEESPATPSGESAGSS
jgi:arsenate reductase